MVSLREGCNEHLGKVTKVVTFEVGGTKSQIPGTYSVLLKREQSGICHSRAIW